MIEIEICKEKFNYCVVTPLMLDINKGGSSSPPAIKELDSQRGGRVRATVIRISKIYGNEYNFA